jgi:cytochrome c556
MRRVSIVIGACFVLALALTVMGQGGRDITAIMKDVGPLATGVAAKAPADAAADAAKLEGLFKEAQSFFAKDKVADAEGWAKAASDAAGKAAKDLKAGTVDKAAKNLGINCKQCHDVHREPGPEKGQFKYKKE